MQTPSVKLPPIGFSEQTQWQSIEISGPDASDFLHRLTTLNFKKFAPGQFSPGAFLQHTGKTIAYFKVLIITAQRFLLLSPQPAQALADAFEKMHFAENLKIQALHDNFSYFRVFGSGASEKITGLTLPEGAMLFPENLWTECPWPAAKAAFDFGIVVEKSKKSLLQATLSEIGATADQNSEFLRITFGEPTWPTELNENTLFTESDYDQAINDNKGCYPGQEVVERIRSMGQSPRRLLLLRSNSGSAPKPGEAILTTAGEPAGVLTSVAAHEGEGWVALGFIKKLYAKPDATFKVGSALVESKFKNLS